LGQISDPTAHFYETEASFLSKPIKELTNSAASPVEFSSSHLAAYSD